MLAIVRSEPSNVAYSPGGKSGIGTYYSQGFPQTSLQYPFPYEAYPEGCKAFLARSFQCGHLPATFQYFSVALETRAEGNDGTDEILISQHRAV